MKFNKPIGINENIPNDVQTLLSVGGGYSVKYIALNQCLKKGIDQGKSKWTRGLNRSQSRVALEYENRLKRNIAPKSNGTPKVPLTRVQKRISRSTQTRI